MLSVRAYQAKSWVTRQPITYNKYGGDDLADVIRRLSRAGFLRAYGNLYLKGMVIRPLFPPRDRSKMILHIRTAA